METVYKTRQELFDFAVAHMDKQRNVSASYRISKLSKKTVVDTCLYRGENGNMCIVGAMIKDEHYNNSLEGEIACADDVMNALTKSGFNINPEDHIFMNTLQDVHDTWSCLLVDKEDDSFNELKSYFIKFAENYNLDATTAHNAFKPI